MRDDLRGVRAPSGLSSSPTGRVPQWVLDQASGRVSEPDPWRSWSPSTPPPSPRPRRRRGPLVLTALALVLVGSLAAIELTRGGVPTRPAVPGWPTPGFEQADAPLGTPVPAPQPGGMHAFTGEQEDGVRPVAYDPCRPIHYVVRAESAPPGGRALVAEAFARVTALTGLQFVSDGETEEAATSDRAPYQPERYGDRWAPVLVAWETEIENPGLAGDIAGLGGSAAVTPPGGPAVYVTGGVSLDAVAFADMLATEPGKAAARAVVLHEIGHLVGLDHVDDPTQLMHERNTGVADFAPGDIAGLVALGRGECVPSV